LASLLRLKEIRKSFYCTLALKTVDFELQAAEVHAMASVWRRSNSKSLTTCFRDHTGRQRRTTTKETNRKSAQKLADEYEKASMTTQ
jgi:hypothetical protein